MSRWIQNFLIAIVGVLSIGCSVAGNNDRLVYKFENDEFILEKECVSVLQLGYSQLKNDYVLNIEINRTPKCSERFNSLLSKNIGKKVSLYFGVNKISQTYIAGEIQSENGYRQAFSDKKVINNILESYGRNAKN
ncbi:hypothetical protein [Providencia stuartii]|uniref:hypothetical protein n=1 Tax=Providencia stuartii TaxID=588 RepID=UPI0034E59933